MSGEEKVEYVDALWGRILERPESVPVLEWQRRVLAERLAEYRAGKAGQGRPWDEVRRDLLAELDKARR